MLRRRATSGRLAVDVRTGGLRGLPGDRSGPARRYGRRVHDPVYNAANEIAAEAFLDGTLRFPAIVKTVERVLAAGGEWAAPPATVDDVLAADGWARARAREFVKQEG